MTTKQRRFIRKQEQLIKRAQKIDDQAIRDMLKLLRQSRIEIAARVAEHEMQISSYPEIKRQVDSQILRFERQYKEILADASERAFVAGQEIVDGGLAISEVGKRIAQTIPAIDETVLFTMTDFSADLVTKVSAEMRQFINNQVFFGVQGGLPVNEVINNIGTRIDKGVFKSAKARAEAIARTEINRVLSTAQEIRNKQVAEIAPETKKFWLTAGDDRVRDSHKIVGRETREKPIPINEDFNVGGSPASGPHDPRLPAREVINCRCSKILIIEE